MGLLWMMCCVVWVCMCHALPQTKHMATNEAQECELYDPQGSNPSFMQFNRRVFVGVIPREGINTAQLDLLSTITGKKCKFFYFGVSIVLSCENHSWPQEKLRKSDLMDLWIEVQNSSTNSWDLKVVVRQGPNRTHMMISDTDLEPPIKLWFNSSQDIQYYFNCVTGCLFEKSVELPSGHSKFYFRHDEGFTQMTINAGSIKTYSFGNQSISLPEGETDYSETLKNLNYITKELFINVTSAQLSSPGGLKEIELVWSKQLEEGGVLVDGVPVGNLTQYEKLSKQQKVTVTIEGGGLVASCHPYFQTVTCGDDEKVTAAKPKPSATSPLTKSSTSRPAITVPSQTYSNKWLPAVFTFVLLNFMVTITVVIFGIILYRCSSSKTHNLLQGNPEPSIIFSRSSSVRSSTKSTHRGSQRRKNKTDIANEKTPDNEIEGTRANSETVTTPLTTPDFPKTSKNISTDEFVDLSLM